MTKTVLIVAAAAVFLVYGFVLWCCIKVGAESEKEYMKEERAWCDCRMK